MKPTSRLNEKKKKIYTKSHYCGTAKHQRQDILKSEGKS